jgi:hypothetical protein
VAAKNGCPAFYQEKFFAPAAEQQRRWAGGHVGCADELNTFATSLQPVSGNHE